MKTENITLVKLVASEGMMLTDGESVGREVYLGVGASPDDWREVTEAEAEEIMKAQEEDA